MKNTTLPNGLKVSPVCLGAMHFGSYTSDEDACAVLDAFRDAGGNFVDTSNNYNHGYGTGDESETFLGEYFSKRGNRNDFVIATKVGFDRHGKGAGLKKEQIEYWIDESLRKLKTDHIDLYYSHTDDANTPIDEYMEAFHRLVEKGKVLHLGASNIDSWRLLEANLTAKENGWTPYTANQQRFTYLNHHDEIQPRYIFNEYTTRERLRFLRDKNIPLVAYSCLAKGGYMVPEKMPSNYYCDGRLDTLRKMAQDKGISCNALLVAWLVNVHRCEGYPQIIPLFASSKVSNFMDALQGVDVSLTDEELSILNNA